MAFQFSQPHHQRRVLYALYTLGALLFLGFAAFVGGILFLQSDYLRNKLSSEGSSRLGRELTIAGPLDVDWHWGGTRVLAQQVRISNAPGLKEPNMLEIETLDFTFKPWKLLFGRLELPSVGMEAPKLVLEKSADGSKNWDFPELSSGNVAASTALPKERGDFPIIGKIIITNGNLIFRDAEKKLDLDLKLESLSGAGTGNDKDDTFSLSGDGTLSGSEFTVDATGGSLLALRDSSRDYPLKANIVMGATTVTIDGTFNDPLKMQGVNADLSVKGENLADLFYLTSIPLPPTPAYDLAGHLDKTGDVWRFNIPNGKVGNSDLKAEGTYDVGRERSFLKMDVAAKQLYMDDLGGFIGLKPKGKETVATSSTKLFPDVKLDLSRMRKSDLDVTLKADKLVAPGLPFQSMDARFNLDNGLLKIEPINAGIASGTMTGHLYLDGRKDVPHLESDLLLRRLSMKEFFNDSRFEDLSSGRFGGRFLLEGDGRSLAEVLGDANGRVSMMMAGGQVSLLLVEAAGLDVAEFTARLLNKDKTTRVRCGIGDFAVKNGMLRSDIFVFDTNDTRIEGDAMINLKNETIDARMETHPKDMSPLVARTPLTLSGPLKRPRIGVEPTGLAARAGGAALLALLNPLAAIIPFIETGGGEDADCRGLIQDVRAKYNGNIPGPTAKEAPAKPAN
mgnify:CR=1 FL=1